MTAGEQHARAIDRIVHAECADFAIVRYDRSGKWYIEAANAAPRQVTVTRAVAGALLAEASGGAIHSGLPGGRRFGEVLKLERARRTGTRACSVCGELKPLTEFYADKREQGGHQAACKACHRERMRRPAVAANRKAYQDRFPERWTVRNAVRQAIVRGELTRPDSCDECGSGGRIEAHHDDYSRPPDVRWLCKSCHAHADSRAYCVMDTKALRALAEAAHDGPWITRGTLPPPTTEIRRSGDGRDAGFPIGKAWSPEDAAYIAAVSPDVLLGILDALADAEENRDQWHSAANENAEHADEMRQLVHRLEEALADAERERDEAREKHRSSETDWRKEWLKREAAEARADALAAELATARHALDELAEAEGVSGNLTGSVTAWWLSRRWVRNRIAALSREGGNGG